MYMTNPDLGRYPVVHLPMNTHWKTVASDAGSRSETSHLAFSGQPLTLSVLGWIDSLAFYDDSGRPLDEEADGFVFEEGGGRRAEGGGSKRASALRPPPSALLIG